MKSKILHVLFLILLNFTVFAQTKKIDSLRKSIYATISPKIEVILSICQYHRSLNTDSLYHYTILAEKLLPKSKDSYEKNKIEFFRAVYYKKTNQENLALRICDKYINYVDLNKSKATDIALDLYYDFILLKANILIRNQKFKEAIQLVYAILPTLENSKNTEAIIRAQNFIGYAHMEMNEHEKAIHFFMQAIATAKKDSYHSKSLGIVYSNLASEYSNLTKKDSAFFYIDKSIQINTNIEDLEGLANAYFIKAVIFKDLNKDYSDAEKNMIVALSIRQKIGDPYYIVSDMAELADFFAETHQPGKGTKIALEGINIAKTYKLNSKLILLLNALAKNYKENKEFKKFGEAEEIIKNLTDTMYLSNSVSEIAEVQAKYESQKKQNQIIEQQYALLKKDYLIFSIILLFIMLAIISLGIYKNKQKNIKLKLQNLQIESERKLNDAIIATREEERRIILADLHDDIGADLSSINLVSGLMNKYPDNKELISDFAKKISAVSNELSQRMNAIFWVLKKENNTLDNLINFIYSYSEKLLEKTGISFRFIGKNLIERDIIVSEIQRKNIFLIVKESLNNILKHSKATNVFISITIINDSTLSLIIYDNGIGISNFDSKGNGLKNIKKRVSEINGNILFKIEKGTKLEISIPI